MVLWQPNEGQSQQMPFLTSSTSQTELKIDNVTIKSSTCEKLLGKEIDTKWRLNAHVED